MAKEDKFSGEEECTSYFIVFLLLFALLFIFRNVHSSWLSNIRVSCYAFLALFTVSRLEKPQTASLCGMFQIFELTEKKANNKQSIVYVGASVNCLGLY